MRRSRWLLFLLATGLGVLPAYAGVFQFNDLTESISVTSTNDSRISGLGCSSGPLIEKCGFNVNAPSTGATITNTNGGLVVSFFIADPGGSIVSDEIQLINISPGLPSFVVNFFSDIETGISTCATVGGCDMTEDGTLQAVPFTVTWSDGTVDSFKFQSDVEAVPVPSSILLVTTGAVFIVWKARGALRRIRQPTSQVV